MISSDTIATVEASLRDNAVGRDIIAKVINDLKTAAQQEKENREPSIKSKTQFVILSTAPGLGYVLQLDEGAPPQVAIDRIKAAVNTFNDSRKGRRNPIKTVGEAMEGLRAKWLKSAVPSERTVIKTKTAIAILTVPNKLA